jgi:hypothetical protein
MSNFSADYQRSVKDHSRFHEKYPKKWAGDSTFGYKDQIKELVDKHQANSLLDYGCGKAQHYVPGSIFNFGTEQNPMTFDQFLGVSEVYNFDPCVEEYNILPADNKKFDAVILIQCLGLVPDADVPKVKDWLMQHTTKFCFIGNQDPRRPAKPCKTALTQNKDYFKIKRTKEWYQEQFADWTGSELVLFFQPWNEE